MVDTTSFLDGLRTVLGYSVSGLVGLLTLASSCLSTGCMSLRGAGEMGMGYRSETKVFVYHTVDGDKQNATAESSPNLERAVKDYAEYLKAKAEWQKAQEPVEAPK